MKLNFTLDSLKAIRKIAEHFVANLPLDFRAKKVKLTIKLTKQKQLNTEGLMYKIDYRFVTKFMHVFHITGFHMVMSFDLDDFGTCFLWCKHDFHFLSLQVLCFSSRCCCFDAVAFVAADVVVGVALFVRFYVVCIVADITVVLPDVSGFLLEAVDVIFNVADGLVFGFVVLFYVFGALFDATEFLVVGSGSVSADGVGVLVDAVGQLVELRAFNFAFASFSFLFSINVNHLYCKDSYLMYHLMLFMYGLGLCI